MGGARLPDDALVVRGGQQLTPADVQQRADEEPDGTWGLSIRTAPGKSLEELVRESEIPHTKIRVSRVGKIRAIGPEFDVRPTDGPGYPPHHGTIVIPSRPVSDEDARAVCNAFDEPIPNPAPVRG